MNDINNDIGKSLFILALNETARFVLEEKGNLRHGNGKPILEQDWKFITDNVGTGFCIGQALKKILEVKNISDPVKWREELKGAISYITFAMVYADIERMKAEALRAAQAPRQEAAPVEPELSSIDPDVD